MRLAQVPTSSPNSYEYFLTDALGSVRQLVDENGALTRTQAYQPYGESLSSEGSGTSNYGFTGEWTDGSGLQYLRARYYAPGQGRFVSKDAWAGDAMRPMSYNGWAYVFGNPINYIDPSGFKLICDADLRNNLSGFGQFPYSITCGTPQKLLVNYSLNPWGRYLRRGSASNGVVQIPIRHSLDLREEYVPSCDYDENREGFINQVRAYYDSDQFTNWELTARLIMTEMGEQLATQPEWALRDAIGIVNTIYNRVEWNKYVIPKWQNGTVTEEEKNKAWWTPYNQNDTNFGDSNWYSFKKILLSGGQLGIMSLAFKGYTGNKLGEERQHIYETALIIAYGVDHRIFEDTSFGAQDFRHRPKQCGVGGPAFFYESYGADSYSGHGLTSGQLWAQQGRNKNEADNSFLPGICEGGPNE